MNARVLLGAAAASVAAAAWYAGSGTFPAGADLAHTLYHGRLLADGTLPPYPPVVPVLGLLAWVVGGGEWTGALLALRFVPLLALGALVLAVHRAVAAWSEPALRAQTAALAALLVAAGGMFWLALVWGGIATVLALAFCTMAVATWHRERSSPQAWRTASWTALAVATNPYPVLTLGLAALGLGLARPREAAAALRTHGRWLLLPASVAVAVYAVLLPAVKTGTAVGRAGGTAPFEMLLAQLTAWSGAFWIPVAALGVVMGGRMAAGQPALDRDWRWILAAVVVGSIALQAVTVMNVVGRMLYALGVLLPMAAALQSAPLAAAPRRVLAGVRVGLVALVVLLPVQVAAVEEAGGYYRPSPDVADAIAALPADLRVVAVHGRDPPTLEAWWIQAATGAEVWAGGAAWPHTFLEDLERNRAARTWAEGTAWVQQDDAVLASGGCTGSGLRLSVQEDWHGHALASVPENGTRPLGAVSWSEPAAQRAEGGRVVDEAEGGTWSRVLQASEGGFVVRHDAAGAAGWSMTWEAPPGTSFRLDASDLLLKVQVRRDAGPPPPAFTLLLGAGTDVVADPAGHWFRLESPGEVLSLEVRVEGQAGPGSVDTRAAAWERAGVDAVYVDNAQRIPGLVRDAALVTVWAGADGARVHEVRSGASCL